MASPRYILRMQSKGLSKNEEYNPSLAAEAYASLPHDCNYWTGFAKS